MKIFYWNERPNFGDAMAPYLARELLGISMKWAPIEQADIVVTGSIMHLIPEDWDGIVMGAGIMRKRLEGNPVRADIRLVRGPLTDRGLPSPAYGTMAHGDPALLANELVNVRTKRYDIGILPHWSDINLAHDARFAGLGRTHVIDPCDNPLKVIKEIGECHKLVTSSLHGVIVADSFGIPRRIEHCDLTMHDTDFKFLDYHQSIRHPLEWGKTTKPARGPVGDVKNHVYDAFRGLV